MDWGVRWLKICAYDCCKWCDMPRQLDLPKKIIPGKSGLKSQKIMIFTQKKAFFKFSDQKRHGSRHITQLHLWCVQILTYRTRGLILFLVCNLETFPIIVKTISGNEFSIEYFFFCSQKLNYLWQSNAMLERKGTGYAQQKKSKQVSNNPFQSWIQKQQQKWQIWMGRINSFERAMTFKSV